MRTLSEIIESAKDGNMPTHEECYWAMLVFNALLVIDNRTIRDLAFRPSKVLTTEFYANESFNRLKNALQKDPKTYMGPNNDPANPDCQKRRQVALKIYDKAMKGELGS